MALCFFLALLNARMCYNTGRINLHQLQRNQSRLEMQVAGKDNAGPSVGGSSTDFVSQNY